MRAGSTYELSAGFPEELQWEKMSTLTPVRLQTIS